MILLKFQSSRKFILKVLHQLSLLLLNLLSDVLICLELDLLLHLTTEHLHLDLALFNTLSLLLGCLEF